MILSQLRSSVIPPSSAHTLPPTLQLPADSEPFDWQHKETEMNPIPTFVRPGKPESPVDINFDHSQAAFGMSFNTSACNLILCLIAPCYHTYHTCHTGTF